MRAARCFAGVSPMRVNAHSEYSHGVSASTTSAPPAGMELAVAREIGKQHATQIRFRGAIRLLFMTLIAPGSAQLSAGNRRVGRLAVWTAVGLVCICVLLMGLWFFWPKAVLWLLASPRVVPVIRWLFFLLAIGW